MSAPITLVPAVITAREFLAVEHGTVLVTVTAFARLRNVSVALTPDEADAVAQDLSRRAGLVRAALAVAPAKADTT